MNKMARTLMAGTLAMALATPSVFASTSSSATYVETDHGWVSVHTAAKLSSPIVGRLLLGEKAPLIAKANAWWYEIQLNGKDVYITTNPKYTKVVTEPVSSTSTSPQQGAGTGVSAGGTTTGGLTAAGSTGTGSNGSTSASSAGSTASGTSTSGTGSANAEPAWQVEADKVIAAAKSQLGVPYWWGHQVPGVGFDCSNFTSWCYRTALGIQFSSSSVTQRNSVGTPVALGDIREGDLLFFATSNNPTGGGHVGIYMGNGKVIQEGGGWGKVTIEPLNGTWLGRNLVFARRVIQ
ncbi:MAG: C40 family peptidase [Alicyclobacillus sp.]|nr:C40 family peptidase [Alicyclobacillus sp.]